MWFINQKYGSWKNLLVSLGCDNGEYGKWAKISEKDLLKIVESFITVEKITSQRMYEKKISRKRRSFIEYIEKEIWRYKVSI